MKKSLLISTLFLLTGCSATPSSEVESDVSTEARVGETTLSGALLGEGNAAILTTADGEIVNVESYAVDFTEYNGETVEVTGEFSGTTLVVDEVSIISN